jgi:hypothetical protein
MRSGCAAVLVPLAAVFLSGSPLAAGTAPPAPYSLPWLLRAAAAANVVRLDETLAFFDGPSGTSSETYVTSFLATRKLGLFAPVFRESWVHNAPGVGSGGGGFSNPLVGVTYVRPFAGAWRASAFFATTLPIGSGGGDTPDPAAQAAMSAAINARSGMDNALFAVNYWTLIVGASAARVSPSLTLQAEVTLLQLTRVRGPESQDASRTNFTAGLHLGHFFSRRLSLAGELRVQRWMSDAAPVRKDPAAREQATLAVGPRLHFKLGPASWIRPGLSYSRALDKPMSSKGYDIVQLDVPVSF